MCARPVYSFVATGLIGAIFIAFTLFPPAELRNADSRIVSFLGRFLAQGTIYENGIKLLRSCFRWEQIEPCSWDGDVLTITGIGQDLSGRPVDGGSARMPFGLSFRHDLLIDAPSQ